eukprot:11202535-Lingulodinium_polyedra.AAC.1
MQTLVKRSATTRSNQRFAPASDNKLHLRTPRAGQFSARAWNARARPCARGCDNETSSRPHHRA